VLRAQRQQDRVVAGRGLQFEVERHAEPLAQRKAERPVQPGAERGVADQLHPAALVEEPLQDDRVRGRQRAERGQPGQQVADDDLHRGLADAALGLEPAAGVRGRTLRNRPAQLGDLLGQFSGPPRCLALPERHRGRCPVRVDHPDGPRLHPADPPGVRAEQEDIARPALHRPFLVHRADLHLVGLGDDPEVAELGDGTARGQRGQPGAAPGLHGPVHLVAVQVVRTSAAAGPDSLAEQLGDVVEVLPRQVTERRRPPDQGEQLVLRPLLGRGLGHQLLGQDVQRLVRDDDGVQRAAAHAAQQRGALHQLVAGRRVQPAGRGPAAGVVGPAHPLQERGDAARRADLAHQLDRADVDAELQRGGRHQRPQVTGPQPGLDPLPAPLGQRPVVRGDVLAKLLT
jgi:hypothetical protein